ncbi:MAG: hypothetical protein D6689_07960 [Deltaproteobacteria bacterium]|nr:MAG: hypothetical protein D6689_07960 [Deltaproteobacteria bacterium]
MKPPVAKPAPEPGPLETYPWPERLAARVVAPGPAPRVHGYCVQADLARHYAFGEALYLCITGSLPDARVARAFDVAMWFAGPVAIAHGAVHAAALAHLVDARDSAVAGTAAIALAEATSAELDDLADLLAWLDAPAGPLPACAVATAAGDRDGVARLRRALAPTGVRPAALDRDPSLRAAVVATLHACGVATRAQLHTALTLARLPFCLAEATAGPRRTLRACAMNVPPVRYRDPAAAGTSTQGAGAGRAEPPDAD